MSLSPTAKQHTADLGLAFTIIRGVLAETVQLEGQERFVVANEIRQSCELLSLEGSQGRKDATKALRDSGKTFDEIAELLGVSRTRVSDLCR